MTNLPTAAEVLSEAIVLARGLTSGPHDLARAELLLKIARELRQGTPSLPDNPHARGGLWDKIHEKAETIDKLTAELREARAALKESTSSAAGGPICTPGKRLDHGHTVACGPMRDELTDNTMDGYVPALKPKDQVEFKPRQGAPRDIAEAPDANCVTLPNGDCVSDVPCMHTELPADVKETLDYGQTYATLGDAATVAFGDSVTEVAERLREEDESVQRTARLWAESVNREPETSVCRHCRRTIRYMTVGMDAASPAWRHVINGQTVCPERYGHEVFPIGPLHTYAAPLA